MIVRADSLDDDCRGVARAGDLELRIEDLLPGESAEVAIDHRSRHKPLAWAHIVGVAPRRASPAGRAAFALGLLAAGMVVGEWLFLSGPLYDVYIDQSERLLGLSPTADQTKAALIMMSEGMVTMLTAAALLMWTHVDRAATEGNVRESPPCAPSESSR